MPNVVNGAAKLRNYARLGLVCVCVHAQSMKQSSFAVTKTIHYVIPHVWGLNGGFLMPRYWLNLVGLSI